MTQATKARANAIPLELKKDGLQQRQNGDWVLRFTVQASDMDERLTKAAMGTRFMAALVEIGENEEPVPATITGSPPSTRPDGTKRMDWREVQPAAQCALRCNDATFRAFLTEEYSFRPRTGEDATEQAAAFLRNWFNISSRSELSTDHRARVLWKLFDDKFLAWKALEHA
jgi:hypothetical protein